LGELQRIGPNRKWPKSSTDKALQDAGPIPATIPRAIYAYSPRSFYRCEAHRRRRSPVRLRQAPHAHDHAGFVAQRVVTHIVNLGRGCAVMLGPGYPKGPLGMGDAVGPAKILAIL